MIGVVENGQHLFIQGAVLRLRLKPAYRMYEFAYLFKRTERAYAYACAYRRSDGRRFLQMIERLYGKICRQTSDFANPPSAMISFTSVWVSMI